MKDQSRPWLEEIDGVDLPSLITSDAPLIRVVAGPGSGKTLGIQRRVDRLIQGEEIEPSRIYVGTFTRVITSDLARSLDKRVAQGVEVSTLHSLAFRLLKENPSAVQGRKLRLLLEMETAPMLYDIGAGLATPSDQNQRKSLLRQLKSDYARRRQLSEAAFSGEVDRWLQRHGGMLIDEVVPIATQALANHNIEPGVFDHVLVDEYQDLTACEQELVERIWSRRGSLVVVGDDNQSIYSFRFNHPGGITDFPSRWADQGVQDIAIGENHRSGSVIVGVANVMSAEAGSPKPPMESRRPNPGAVARVFWPDIDEEVKGLAAYVASQPDHQFLVLVPLRLLGNRLQQAMGDDARTSFNQELLAQKTVRERFALASLVANPEDNVALRTWLGLRSHSSDYGPEWNSAAYRSAAESGFEGTVLARAIADGEIAVKGKGRKNLISRAEQLVQHVGNMPQELEAKIDLLFDPSFADREDDDEKRDWARKGLDTLRKVSREVLESEETGDLSQIMGRLRYQIATRSLSN